MNIRQKKTKRSQMMAGTSKSSQHNFDCIPMSKQLKTKKQARGRIKRTVKRTMNRKILHAQNKPMPTFNDLEKMFEDPAGIHTAPDVTSNIINSSASTTDHNTILEQNITDTDRKNGIICNIVNPHRTEENILDIHNKTNCENSIQTVSLIETMMPKVINCNEIITIDDDESVHNVQDRKRKLDSPKNNGMLNLEDLDDEMPQKLRKYQSLDLPKDDSGSDSDVTIVYDLEAPPVVSPINSSSSYKRFSPLPSTSTDSATILKNDKIFLECLSANNSSIETEELNTTNKHEMPIVIDDDFDELPSVSTKNTTGLESLLPVSIDIDDIVVTDSNIDADIDIDEIIACNRTLLTKYKTVENLPAVIEVVPVENITISNVTHNELDNMETSETPFGKRQELNQRIPSTATATDSFSTSSTNTTSNLNTNASIDYINSRNSTHSTNTNLTNATHSRISSINVAHSTNNNVINAASSNILNLTFTPQVSNLQTSVVANSSQSPEVSAGLNCPICLDNLRSTECASTLCGHIFCMDCIKRALRSSRRCPTCRKTIKGNNGYHRLFL